MKKQTKIPTLIILLLCIFSVFSPILSSASEDYYIVNATSGKFHLPTCSYLPEPGNRYTIPREDINLPKYSKLSPCKHCDPLNNFVYTPENPGQHGGYIGNSSGKPSGNYDYLEYQGEEHTEYYKFKNSYLDFVETYGFLIPAGIVFIFSIYEGIARYFNWEGTKRLIGKVLLYGGIFFLAFDVSAAILGHIIFSIIEIVL